MTVIYILMAVLILLVVYWARGPRYALGALLVLGAMYIALVWRITTSM